MSPVTDRNLEDLLRATFRAKEPLAPRNADRLADAVLAAHGRRRRAVRSLAAAAVLAVLATPFVVAVIGMSQQSNGSGNSGAGSYPGAVADPPPGWQWEIHLGMRVGIPQSWVVLFAGCGVNLYDRTAPRNAAPMVDSCAALTGVEVAAIAAAARRPASFGPVRSVLVDGVRVERAEGRLPDGRYAGWAWLADRRVAVDVRTRSAALTARILDSQVVTGQS
jgi:hypothetical protein